MDIRSTLVHAVTAYDRKQEEKSRKNPRAYHNHYALPQYLMRIDDIMADIDAGTVAGYAIVAGFTPGPLRNACLRSIGIKADNTESSGSYKGLPVYSPVSKR